MGVQRFVCWYQGCLYDFTSAVLAEAAWPPSTVAVANLMAAPAPAGAVSGVATPAGPPPIDDVVVDEMLRTPVTIPLPVTTRASSSSTPPAPPSTTTGTTPTPPTSNAGRIVLTCTKNHANVFVLPLEYKEDLVHGERPAPSDTFWMGTVAQFTPDKSMATLLAQARWIFSSVGVIGTVLVGFTLIAASRLQTAPLWLTAPTILLTVASLFCAAIALVPYSGDIDPANVTKIAKLWNGDVTSRGNWVKAASVTFAVAIAAAAATAIFVATHPVQDGVTTVGVVNNSDGTHTVSASIVLSNLPAGASVETTIQGSNPDSTAVALFDDTTTADDSGAATITATVPGVGDYKTFTVKAVVMMGKQMVRTETDTLTPSP